MSNKKKIIRTLPTFLLSAILATGATLKIASIHPMMPHFVELGLLPFIKVIGTIEFLCAILFAIPGTFRLGLLLLTAFLGGAMAVEMPYHMIGGPATVLVLVWVAAFIRTPGLFILKSSTSLTVPNS